MRALGNLLVWAGLMIGLPGLLYAMTIVKSEEEMLIATAHATSRCSVCQHYRGGGNEPPPIQNADMILVSPAHENSCTDWTQGE
jgi:hypothetical protein